MGRRYRKVVEEDGVTNYTNWVYDGYNAIAKYTRSAGASEASLARTYYRGKDLGGGEGTGGMLAEYKGSTSYFPLFDGNGNITDYVDSTGAVVAHYQYDSFGKVLASSGAKKDEMDYGFSTRVNDRDLGLSYYNFRYYDSVDGRWPGRDPIGERGGNNLYVFVSNQVFNRYDYLGLNGKKTAECCKIGEDGNVLKKVKYDPTEKCCFRGEVKTKRPCKFTIVGGHGDRVTGCCCFTRAVNGQFKEDELIPGAQAPDIGGMIAFNNPDFADAEAMLRAKILAAQVAAVQSCTGCCKKVTIRVNCLQGGRPNFREVAKKMPSVNAMCNYQNTYDCKKERWEKDLIQ